MSLNLGNCSQLSQGGGGRGGRSHYLLPSISFSGRRHLLVIKMCGNALFLKLQKQMSAMVNNFKRVSEFSPLLASSKDLADIYLKTSCVEIMTRKDNDGQVVIRVHVQRGIFFA